MHRRAKGHEFVLEVRGAPNHPKIAKIMRVVGTERILLMLFEDAGWPPLDPICARLLLFQINGPRISDDQAGMSGKRKVCGRTRHGGRNVSEHVSVPRMLYPQNQRYSLIICRDGE